MADGTLSVKAGALGSTSMRYHELALQRWLNRKFFVREGYPVPVVFATPMDAFGNFGRLWSQANNPFQYLLDAKDEDGTPLYQPHPQPVRYPLLSVYRKGWRYRSYQNFSIHRHRRINWPTVSSLNDGIGKCELGNVMTSKMPMAWDYRFQINHFATRPDSQAFFLEKFIREFQDTGGVPQCWIPCWYPIWGMQLIRMYIDGDVENASPEDVDNESQVEFNTAVTVVVEGFSIDVKPEVLPALWYVVFGQGGTVDPEQLEVLYTQDARIDDNNVTLDARPNVPPDEQCQIHLREGETSHDIQFGDPSINPNPPQPPQGTPFVWPPQPGWPGGIPPTVEFGIPTITLEPPTPPPIAEFSGTESGGQFTGFQVGSIEIVPHIENLAQLSTFNNGTLFPTIVHGGTTVDEFDQLTAFFNGTLFPVTVLVDMGTNFSEQSTAFSAGTLTPVIVDGGTFVDYGTQASMFLNGTNQLVVILSEGTESVGNVSSFLEGSLDEDGGIE